MAGRQAKRSAEGLLERGVRGLRHAAGWRLAKLRQLGWECFSRAIAHSALFLRWNLLRSGRTHRLPGELIVSLTSYPARYATLALTLKCLLAQSIKADKTILWIAHEDMASLPKSITGLQGHGLEIRPCKNIRSYKKIIPALAAFPEAFIATADDDVYYSSDWLEKMVSLAGNNTIVCHRAHMVSFDESGNLEPYDEWHFDETAVSPILFPTGVGGVLYAPGSLAQEVLDEAEFTRLCPSADDVWLFWMGRRAGSSYVTAGTNWSPVPWKGTQTSALYLTNVGQSANDEQIKGMIRTYGNPFDDPVRNKAA
jgi:hypothetical protein